MNPDQQHAARQYWEKQILNASPAERIVLLYQGAIKFLLQTRQAIENGDIEARFNSNRRAGDIIAYLNDTLDMEKGGKVAESLSRIYGYMLRRLMDVDFKNDVAIVDEVLGHLRTLKSSWDEVAKVEGQPADSAQTAASAPQGAGQENMSKGQESQQTPPSRRSAIA